MWIRSSLLLASVVAISGFTLGACGSKPLGADRVQQQENQGKQQVKNIRKKTDAADQAIQQSEQRINDAEKQIEQPQPAPSPTN